VPVLSVWLFRGRAAHEEHRGLFARAADAYGRLVEHVVHLRWLAIVGYVLVCGAALLLSRAVGTELFPRVDTGQFQLRIRAPAGTRLERTVEIVRGVDQTIREEAGGDHVRMTLANVGQPAWTYPVNAVYVFNSGPQDAVLLAQLGGSGRPQQEALEAKLRGSLAKKFPGVHFSFEAGDIAKAEACWRKVRECATATPDWPKAVFNLGLLEYKRSNFRQAIAYFSEVLQAQPNDREPGGNLMQTNRNYTNRSALAISECYEAMGAYGSALHYASDFGVYPCCTKTNADYVTLGVRPDLQFGSNINFSFLVDEKDANAADIRGRTRQCSPSRCASPT